MPPLALTSSQYAWAPATIADTSGPNGPVRSDNIPTRITPASRSTPKSVAISIGASSSSSGASVVSVVSSGAAVVVVAAVVSVVPESPPQATRTRPSTRSSASHLLFALIFGFPFLL